MFCNRWNASLDTCHNSLDFDHLLQATRLNSWDDIQTQILKAQDDRLRKSAHHELALLASALVHLRTFTDFFARQAVPNLDTSTL